MKLLNALCAAAVAAAIWSGGVSGIAPAAAQDWPQRPVRLILPFGAGTATDISARLLGERLSAKWKQPVVVENRPGGDGIVAISSFINANDDHVLLFASSASFLAHPYTQEKQIYVLERDLAPIAQVTDTVLSLTVPIETGVTSIEDFLKAARANPDKVNTAGAAGVPQFTMQAFVKSQNLKTTNIPYREVVQGARDLAENNIQLYLSSVAVMRGFVEAKKARILAVAASKRSPLYKDVPSVAELGFPDLVVETTAGFYGPKDMPLALRKRIATDVIDVLKDPGVAAKIAGSGQDIRTGGPDVLAETLKQQSARTAAVAKILGMNAK
jgi:tripartite-type tricarboxylate transporter receptor subunit TctC